LRGRMPPEIARLRAAVEHLECAIGSITEY
jgi:hypothetical protein